METHTMIPQSNLNHAQPFKEFEYTTLVPTTMEAIIRFHEKSDALQLLTPPPLIVQIINDQRISNTQGSVEFILWFGPIPVRWVARHEAGPLPTSFIDRMTAGPMAYWQHQHIFLEAAGGVALMDKLTFAHKSGWRGWITRLAFDGLALRFLFRYRHWRTQRACRKMNGQNT
jgi:ligand-binding SRPBCC domain-containing protein